MKRKWSAAAIGLVMLMAGTMTAQAEIQDAKEYVGDWYANYLYDAESDMNINVPGVLESSIIITLKEDGTLIQKMTSSAEGTEEEEVTGTWELKDNQIIMDIDGEQSSMDEIDGEVRCDVGDGSYMIMGREEIVEEVDWDAMMADMGEDDELEQAKEAKENPYCYNPEDGNVQEVIAAYVKCRNAGYEFEVVVDEENKTFTADCPGDEYSDPSHYEGTYEITADNYINAKWRDEEYDYDVECNGAEFVQGWDELTVKEDLSNVKDVIAAMGNHFDYGYDYTAENVTMTEDTETEGCGTVVLAVDDHEFSCDYEIVPGGDPIVKLSYYDEAYEYDATYNNHNLREVQS